MMMLEDAEHVFLAILDIHISLIFRSQMKAKFEITSCFLSQNKTRSLLKFYFTSFCWNFSMASCSSILILPPHLLFTSFFTFCLTICFFFFLLKTKQDYNGQFDNWSSSDFANRLLSFINSFTCTVTALYTFGVVKKYKKINIYENKLTFLRYTFKQIMLT